MLVQPEMERGRFPLVSIPPYGRGIFKPSGATDLMGFSGEGASEGFAPPLIVLMSPSDYPSAWLRPRSAASVSPGRFIVAPPQPARPTSG